MTEDNDYLLTRNISKYEMEAIQLFVVLRIAIRIFEGAAITGLDYMGFDLKSSGSF